MARNRFRGDAAAVSQVRSFTITAVNTGDAVSVTINSKTVSYTPIGGDTTTTAAAALVTALEASTYPEFMRIDWDNTAGLVFGTAADAGKPFTFTAAGTGSTTVSGSGTNTTASAGPNHWDTAANWSLGTVPATGEDVDLQDCDVDISFGLAQSGVTLASLNIESTYTGKIGLPRENEDGYVEYLDTELAIGATLATIGAGTGPGSSMIKLNYGTIQNTTLILNSATASVTGQPAVWLKGTHASNVITVSGGQVGLAFELGSSMTVATMNVAEGPNSPPLVQYGTGLTLTNANVDGGKVYGLAGLTTLTQNGGEFVTAGISSVNITTASIRGGRFYPDAPGTIGTLSTYANGVADFTRDPRAKTVTNCTAYGGSTLDDRFKHVTFTNPVSTPDGIAPYAPGGANINLGVALSVQRS